MTTIFNRKQRFSIRKFNVGVASVLLGTALVGLSPTVLADEVENNEPLVVLEESPPVANIEVGVEEIPAIEVTVTNVDVEEAVKTEEILATSVIDTTDTESSEIQEVEIKVSAGELTDLDKVDTSFDTDEEALEKEEPIVEKMAITTDENKTQFSTREAKVLTETVEEVIDEAPTIGLGGAYIDDYVPINPYSRSASHLIGDDYPWKHHNPNVWEADTWGAYKRQCTSFVAYRLSSVNNFEIPYAYGNAGAWGDRARREGYRVDMTPAKGAVAWFGPAAFGGDPNFGHVAWVANVYGDKVELEEYNVNDSKAYYTRIINRNEVSGYIHFKDLPTSSTVTTTPTSSTAPTTPATSIPNSGRYTFTSRVGVKSEAKISSPDLAYYNAGNYVNYDSVLQADGYQWISYISYLGGRSYIPIAKLTTQTTTPVATTPTTPTNSATTLPSSGRYTFTSQVGVKSEAKISSPDLAYYNAGNYVNYDSVLQADGYQWISYISYLGGRSYIPVAKLDTQATPAVSQPTIPSRGTYTFTKRTSVQNEPKVNSPEVAFYAPGGRVNYDRTLVADGHQWISYMSRSGIRRYARID